MFTNKTVIALALTLFLSCAVPAGESGNGMAHGAPAKDDQKTAHEMWGMSPDLWDSPADASFLSAMIVHHEAALEMAKAVVDTTKDPSVEKWAEAILATQQKEIDQMQSLLGELKMKDDDAAEIMGIEMKEMLELRMSDNPDVNFVMTMIPHHASAIDMSLPPLVMSKNVRIRTLASDIIVAQTKEILEFRNWLDQNH